MVCSWSILLVKLFDNDSQYCVQLKYEFSYSSNGFTIYIHYIVFILIRGFVFVCYPCRKRNREQGTYDAIDTQGIVSNINEANINYFKWNEYNIKL